MERALRWAVLGMALVDAAACGLASSGAELGSTQPTVPPTASAPSVEASLATTTPPTQVGAAWPAAIEGTMLTFGSIDRALAFVRRNLAIPVRLPNGLPAGIRIDRSGPLYVDTRDGQRAAQLGLVFGSAGQRHLIVQFGVAVLDGCAPEEASATTVSGQDALVYASPGPWTDLIWPATHEHPTGTYGLSGSFSSEVMLTMAASMPAVRGPAMLDVGC
jgi:hypothetical protein